ncbi:CotH kinase family protein [Bacteroides caccae]|uniref:CotH kinase family protein n=1 Tax=Bacteroides caccae TaxID=47678 RepID=UPI0021653EEB|nr:CotH kinase family protein [Bacteroides caccae]MCS2365667.1 CotH kinase family protein [Bacteroides caccae]MCS3190430.1 CotH kinase family protein [Bacteroides caccae]
MEASIQGSVITLPLDKYDDLKSLIAVFEYNGKSITIDGVEQESGVTSNDYSQPLVFTVEAEDGSKQQYTVEIALKDTGVLSAFRFLKKNNAFLTADVSSSIGEESIIPLVTFSQSELIPTFTTNAVKVLVGEVEQKSGMTKNDFSSPVVYQFIMRNGETFQYTVKAEFLLSAIPELTITTTDPSIAEIPSKDYYLEGTLAVNGRGGYEDYTGKTEVKGRGNSTWGYPKKPYRLKLNKKAEICGLGKAKNYVLLANHLDPTLMLNSVAFKIGRLLELPFTNHAIPVDVVLNGIYKGSYLLTEQIEVKENRVDLDENNSVMWELDSYWDDEPKFKSTAFNLPVMVKDPDLTTEQFEYWKKDFNAFTTQFAKEPLEGNSYVDMIDIESVAKFLITFNLVHNMEINHPKSVFLHKEGNGKYVMGPIWDFDWAYDYEGTSNHFGRYNTPLFSSSMNGVGTAFFQRFLQDSRVKAIYKRTWQDFKNNKLDALLQYVDDYAVMLKPSVERNSELWENTRSFDTKVKELKTWLRNRADYIDSEVSKL